MERGNSRSRGDMPKLSSTLATLLPWCLAGIATSAIPLYVCIIIKALSGVASLLFAHPSTQQLLHTKQHLKTNVAYLGPACLAPSCLLMFSGVT